MSEIKAVNKSNSNLSVTMKDLTPQTYTYDAIGNRLTSADVSGEWSYDANNELLSFDDIAYDYDDEGNMVQKTAGATVTDYIYDIENRLVRVEDGAGSVIAEYYYDPFGRRLWKEVGGSRTYYFYSDEGLTGEYNSGGTEIKTYGYAPDSVWGTNPLFQKIGGSYYWYINDHLGTPQMIIDTTGREVWTATYDSFGMATVTTEEITNNLRFPGQYFDAESGLHYNWNRYYDSSIGRYASEDPIGVAGGINLYAYVGNNPVNLIDPKGLEGCGPGGMHVPDQWGFKECCDEHDDCYTDSKSSSCILGEKYNCDWEFCACVFKKCLERYNIGMISYCLPHGFTYCLLVIEFGGWVYL